MTGFGGAKDSTIVAGGRTGVTSCATIVLDSKPEPSPVCEPNWAKSDYPGKTTPGIGNLFTVTTVIRR
jgi:hypothetical protein